MTHYKGLSFKHKLIVTDEILGNLNPNPKVGEDGKVELNMAIDKDTNKKLEKLSKKLHQPKQEVLENVITKHLDGVKNGKVCCLCGKKLIGMGNNPAPIISDGSGRCCDDCNMKKVLPEREKNPNWREITKELSEGGGLDEGSIKEIMKGKKKNKNVLSIFQDGFDIEKLYEYCQIPVEDRLKNFQVLNYFSKNGISNQPIVNNLFYRYFIEPLVNSPEDKKKGYYIDDDLAEKILKRKNYPETLLPFQSTIIDCSLLVENRFYVGFICGKFYFDKPYLSYTGIISCYVEKQGEDYIIGEQLVVLEKEALEVFGTKEDKYSRKIKNFIYGVLGFINEPDVEIFNHPLNPRNNQRRIEKGRLPLPSFVTIKVTGKKRIYLEKHNSLPPQPKNFQFQQDVKNTYIHFWNKKKYKRLYDLYEEDRQNCLRKGYEWYPPKEVLRKRKKGFTRFKDLPRRNVSYVLEDEKYKDIETKKNQLKEIVKEIK